jgi:hypothetical protein
MMFVKELHGRPYDRVMIADCWKHLTCPARPLPSSFDKEISRGLIGHLRSHDCIASGPRGARVATRHPILSREVTARSIFPMRSLKGAQSG